MTDAPVMISEIGDYFSKGCGRCERFDTSNCSTRRWEHGLAQLRRLCNEAGLEEHVKWGHPCYMHAGRNVALIGAFQESFTLGFFHPGLMKDPEQVLTRRGPNTQHADQIRFTNNDDVLAMQATIKAYLAEAKEYAAAGIKQPKQEMELSLPDELVDALDDDPELAEAFHALTPGRQRSYVITIGGAKKAETRLAHIAKFRNRIIDGKGANEL